MTTYDSRKAIPDSEKWNLSDIYSSIKEWEENYAAVEKNGTGA
jgi:oligoendopeptidase F